MNKRGQMKLSFGMIFSIILIILFLIVGFVAIQKFLDFKDRALVSKFYDDLNNRIDKAWKNTISSELVAYNLPKKVQLLCIKESSSKTVIGLYGDYIGSYHSGGSDYRKKLYEEKTFPHLSFPNPEICIKPTNGKVKFYIEKDFADSLPKIKTV